MSAAQIHANDPNYWLGTLAASVGHYLKGEQPKTALAEDYRNYWQWDVELQDRLPEPPPKERRRA